MMHIKNTLTVLEAAVHGYLQDKVCNGELSLKSIENCAKSVLEYVEQERAARVRESDLGSVKPD